jgi:hypothetical protein
MADAFLLSIDLHKLMDHFADSGQPMSMDSAMTGDGG